MIRKVACTEKVDQMIFPFRSLLLLGPTQLQERARAPSPPPSRQRRTCKIFAETNLRQALIVKGLQRIRGVALLLWHLLSQSSDLRGDSKIDRLGVEVIHELSKQT